MHTINIINEYNIRFTCIKITTSILPIIPFKLFLELYNLSENDINTPKLNSLN